MPLLEPIEALSGAVAMQAVVVGTAHHKAAVVALAVSGLVQMKKHLLHGSEQL